MAEAEARAHARRRATDAFKAAMDILPVTSATTWDKVGEPRAPSLIPRCVITRVITGPCGTGSHGVQHRPLVRHTERGRPQGTARGKGHGTAQGGRGRSTGSSSSVYGMCIKCPCHQSPCASMAS